MPTAGTAPPCPWPTRLCLAAFAGLLFPLAILTFNSLGEDAFITFRYVENAAAGRGLVFNPGERVEGFSNPLWLTVLVAFRVCGVAPAIAARLLSIACLAALVFAAGRVAFAEERRSLRWWLPLAIAFQPFLFYHLSQGLETVSYAAILGGMMFAVGEGRWRWAAAMGVLAVWSRPEGVGFVVSMLPALITGARGSSLADRVGESGDSPSRVERVALLVAPVAALLLILLARRAYFGEWVPNTVIAKRPSTDHWGEILRLLATWWCLPLLGMAGCLAGLRDAATRRLALAALGMVLAGFVFQWKIGSIAAAAFRYLVPVLAPTLVGVWLLLREASRWFPPRRIPAGCACLLGALSLWPLFAWNSPWFVGNSGDDPNTRLPVRVAQLVRHPDIAGRVRYWLGDPMHLNADAGKWVKDHLLFALPKATFAADQVGMLGYYAGPTAPVVDLIGLMDPEIARHGLAARYLLERDPDFVIVWVYTLHPWVKPSAIERAVVPSLRPVLESREFMARWRPWYEVRSRSSYYGAEFLVYGRNNGEGPDPPEIVAVGATDEEIAGTLRITKPADVPPPAALIE